MCLLSSYQKRELNLQLTLALLASSFLQALSVIFRKMENPSMRCYAISPPSHTICKLSLHIKSPETICSSRPVNVWQHIYIVYIYTIIVLQCKPGEIFCEVPGKRAATAHQLVLWRRGPRRPLARSRGEGAMLSKIVRPPVCVRPQWSHSETCA